MIDSPLPPARDRDALVAEAMAHRRAGRFGDAAALFALALRQTPSDVVLLLLAGETLFRLGRLFAAHDAVTAALAIVPETPDALFLSGRILIALGQPAAAAQALARVTAHRADPAAWRFLGCA